MPYFCITIHGHRHCFEIPLLIDVSQIHRPGPINMPPFELALTVKELVRVIQPVAPDEPLLKELAEVTGRYIRNVQAGLPTGVQFVENQAQEKTA